MIKRLAKRFAHVLFRSMQRARLDVLPRHFYSEVPDLRVLRKSTSWRRPFDMRHVRGADVPSQAAFLRSLVADPATTRRAQDAYAAAREECGHEGYGVVEASVLWAFIETFRPARVVQVGAGFGTAVCLHASAARDHPVQVTCIDPYPDDYLRSQAAANRVRLVEQPVQDVDVAEFRMLGKGDLLFIDSTHTLGPAGECTRLVLEVLPALAAGVFVHVHDVYFPYDYTRNVLRGDLVFPHESPLLHAFLTCNPSYTVRASLSMLHYAAPETIRSAFPGYAPSPNDDGLAAGEGHFPSSLYLEALGPCGTNAG